MKLDLKENHITYLGKDTFGNLTNLNKLDISSNRIYNISDDAFIGLSSLERLDLSGNHLFALRGHIFRGLKALHKLSVRDNFIFKIELQAMAPLVSLKTLDVGNNSVVCDCELTWLRTWATSQGVTFSPDSDCHYPLALRKTWLGDLQLSQLHCERGLELAQVHVVPRARQLVFAGDPLEMECLASQAESGLELKWQREGGPESISYLEEDFQLFLWRLTLFIPSLDPGLHAGSWPCVGHARNASQSAATYLLVVDQTAQPCPASHSSSPRGTFHWPETLPGLTAQLLCPALLSSLATRFCFHNGSWDTYNTSACPFLSPLTRFLEQLASHVEPLEVAHKAWALFNSTRNPQLLENKMDVVFAVRTVENLSKLAGSRIEIKELLFDVTSSLMKVDPHLLKEAQAEDNSCSRLVQALNVPLGSLSRRNSMLAVEEFYLKPGGFTGFACQENLGLRCTTSYLAPNAYGLEIPSSLRPDGLLQVAYFSLGVFFPVQDPKTMLVSPVIAAHLASFQGSWRELPDPIRIQLKVTSTLQNLQPVWWDSTISDGKGGWSSDGCHMDTIRDSLVAFHCNKLGSYGLLQVVRSDGPSSIHFQPGSVPILLGSCVCCLELLLALGFLLLARRGSPQHYETHHSLANTWVAQTILTLTFALGAWQTDQKIPCQAVGAVLHYFLLGSLLWSLLSARNLQKLLSLSPEPQNDNLEAYPKPTLRFYLVGWGIPLILCGITVALQPSFYQTAKCCFIQPVPGLIALYGPAILILILIGWSFFASWQLLGSLQRPLLYQLASLGLFLVVWGSAALAVEVPGCDILYCVTSIVLGGYVLWDRWTNLSTKLAPLPFIPHLSFSTSNPNGRFPDFEQASVTWHFFERNQNLPPPIPQSNSVMGCGERGFPPGSSHFTHSLNNFNEEMSDINKIPSTLASGGSAASSIMEEGCITTSPSPHQTAYFNHINEPRQHSFQDSEQ